MLDSDPRQTLISFLHSLPQTIRTEALLFIILYAMQIDPPDDTGALEGTVINYLMKPSAIGSIGAVICAIAVIDHSLEGLVGDLSRAESALKALPNRSPRLQQALLSFPLRKRHWEQALAEWEALRATKLTPRNLREFEDSQLALRRTR